MITFYVYSTANVHGGQILIHASSRIYLVRMGRTTILIWLGSITLIIPLLGVYSEWKTVALMIVGSLIVVCAFSLRRELEDAYGEIDTYSQTDPEDSFQDESVATHVIQEEDERQEELSEERQ